PVATLQRNQAGTVSAVGYRGDPVWLGCDHQFSRFRAPYPDRRMRMDLARKPDGDPPKGRVGLPGQIRIPSGETPAVGAKCQSMDRIPSRNLKHQLAGSQIPEPCGPVFRPGYYALPVRAERDRGYIESLHTGSKQWR